MTVENQSTRRKNIVPKEGQARIFSSAHCKQGDLTKPTKLYNKKAILNHNVTFLQVSSNAKR